MVRVCGTLYLFSALFISFYVVSPPQTERTPPTSGGWPTAAVPSQTHSATTAHGLPRDCCPVRRAPRARFRMRGARRAATRVPWAPSPPAMDRPHASDVARGCTRPTLARHNVCLLPAAPFPRRITRWSCRARRAPTAPLTGRPCVIHAGQGSISPCRARFPASSPPRDTSPPLTNLACSRVTRARIPPGPSAAVWPALWALVSMHQTRRCLRASPLQAAPCPTWTAPMLSTARRAHFPPAASAPAPPAPADSTTHCPARRRVSPCHQGITPPRAAHRTCPAPRAPPLPAVRRRAANAPRATILLLLLNRRAPSARRGQHPKSPHPRAAPGALRASAGQTATSAA